MDLVESLVENRGEHEIFLALSSLLDGSIEAIRAKFHGVLPSENIRVWSAPGPVDLRHGKNAGRAKVAELVREAFLANLEPDLLLLSHTVHDGNTEAASVIDALPSGMSVGVIVDSACGFESGAPIPQWAHQFDRSGQTHSVLLLRPLHAETVGQALDIPSERMISLATHSSAAFDKQDLRSDASSILGLLKRSAVAPLEKPASRHRLAYVSPLPPQKSGIAGYSAELLPELSTYYDIDVVTGYAEVSNTWVLANCTLRTVEWFRENASQYQRVIYHLGNNPMHAFMFDLLDEIPAKRIRSSLAHGYRSCTRAMVTRRWRISSRTAFMRRYLVIPGAWACSARPWG